MSKIEYKELIAFHPGYYLKEMIEYEGMNQDELAKVRKTSKGEVVHKLKRYCNLCKPLDTRGEAGLRNRVPEIYYVLILTF